MDMPDKALNVFQADPLRRLVDSVLAGDDVTLFIRSDDGRDLLDAAAGCLAAMRCRVLRATGTAEEGLGLPALMEQAIGQPVPGAQNDEFLKRSFQAFTTLDPTCDRIVLLVSDANTLRPTALRYIQLACRAGAGLQLVLAGKRGFLDLLDHPEFAYLRKRLATGPIITPVPPRPALAAAASQPPRAIQELFEAEAAAQAGQKLHSGPQLDRPMLSSLASNPHRRRFPPRTRGQLGHGRLHRTCNLGGRERPARAASAASDAGFRSAEAAGDCASGHPGCTAAVHRGRCPECFTDAGSCTADPCAADSYTAYQCANCPCTDRLWAARCGAPCPR